MQQPHQIASIYHSVAVYITAFTGYGTRNNSHQAHKVNGIDLSVSVDIIIRDIADMIDTGGRLGQLHRMLSARTDCLGANIEINLIVSELLRNEFSAEQQPLRQHRIF